MFAAISGLKQHQVMLDVTANDIANVNTIGYKSARVTFSDSLNQLQRGRADRQVRVLQGRRRRAAVRRRQGRLDHHGRRADPHGRRLLRHRPRFHPVRRLSAARTPTPPGA